MKRLRAIGSNALYVLLKRPSVLRRGGNPLTWAIRRAFAEWRFESVATDDPSFVTGVTGASAEQAKAIYSAVNTLPDSASAKRDPLLYALTRLADPATVVETGVGPGSSSAAILQALQDNGHGGQLYSIDLPPSGELLADGLRYAPHPGGAGWRVPDDLRSRWHLLLDDAKVMLPALLSSVKSIDVFLHDSLHTEEHMMWEYQAAWPYLRRGGLLLSHDIGVSFLRFSQMHGRQFYCTSGPRSRHGAIIK